MATSHAAHAAWDAYFGGIEKDRSTLSGDLGYADLPRIEFLHGISDRFAIGGKFAFNLSYYIPSVYAGPNFLFGVPLRVSFYNGPSISAGMKIVPTFALGLLGGNSANVAFDLESNIGIKAWDVANVGGGIKIPFLMSFGPFGAVIPILIGPTAELHTTPNFGIAFDAKLGPYFVTTNGTPTSPASSGITFGMRISLGASYQF